MLYRGENETWRAHMYHLRSKDSDGRARVQASPDSGSFQVSKAGDVFVPQDKYMELISNIF